MMPITVDCESRVSYREATVTDASTQWPRLQISRRPSKVSPFPALFYILELMKDRSRLREKSKMKLWKEYLRNHGRNLTLIRYPGFNRLVQVGLPNRLRGEVWELTCGSLFLRLGNPGVYARILKENAGRTSSSTEDIEKDLHRS